VLFGAVELADLAEVDLRETNLDLLVFLVVELAVAQFAFHGEVRALFQSCGERRKTLPKPTAASDGDAVVTEHAKQESQDGHVRDTAQWTVALQRVLFQLALGPNLLAAATESWPPRLS
jgi:hypothetical protein